MSTYTNICLSGFIALVTSCIVVVGLDPNSHASDKPNDARSIFLPISSEVPLDNVPEDLGTRRFRIGTFNIRMFPCNRNCTCMRRHGYEHCRHWNDCGTDMRRLTMEIGKLRVDILAVNEILEPETFRSVVKKRLGHKWRFVYAHQGGPLKIGFLFNTLRVELLQSRVFENIYTGIASRSDHSSHCFKFGQKIRPALACRFHIKGTSSDFFAVVVHLKSGDCLSVRRAQWGILARIVDRLAQLDRDIIILGDFNCYDGWEAESRAYRTSMRFQLISQDIPCSFVGRKTSSIDHLLVSQKLVRALIPGSVRLGGPCALNCRRNRYRAAYLKSVSDHCPVVADFRTFREGPQ
jgi:endonuclease/exonuclease/phosphatase family metal-dependent hydrolase